MFKVSQNFTFNSWNTDFIRHIHQVQVKFMENLNAFYRLVSFFFSFTPLLFFNASACIKLAIAIKLRKNISYHNTQSVQRFLRLFYLFNMTQLYIFKFQLHI
jgi:hypothetical protein